MKRAVTKKAKLPNGMTDDPKKAGIPPALQVQNRQSLTPERQAQVEEIMKKAMAAAYEDQPWDKPKGMSAGEYEAWKAREEASAAKAERTPREPKAASTPRPSREGMVTVAAIAQELDLLPREARAILRAAKIAKPSCGWAYKPDDAALEIVRAALKAGPVKGVKKSPGKRKMTKIAVKAKELKESGAVFAGKAKVKRTKSAPPAPSPTKREKLLKDLKQSVKQTAKAIAASKKERFPASKKKSAKKTSRRL